MEIQFKLKRGENNYCNFYSDILGLSSGRDVRPLIIRNSSANDLIHSITAYIRKTESKIPVKEIYKVVLITSIGDVFVFNTIDELKIKLEYLFLQYPNTVIADYNRFTEYPKNEKR